MTERTDRHEIGGYRFVRLLGKGGMGAVYEAVGPDGARRAVKVFTLDHGNRDFLLRRFQIEAQMLRQLGGETAFVRTGARFVHVWDSGVEDGTPWFAMDLVLNAAGEPETLETARNAGGVDEATARRWFADLSATLAVFHARGIVHRDVKLENVLVDAGGHAVLADFGVSRIFDEDLRRRLDVTTTFVEGQTTGTRPVMGTYFYLAPEVRAGRGVTPATDLYALGVLFFRFLTGMWYEPPTTSTKVDGGKATSPFDLLLAFDPFWQTNLRRLLSDDPAMRAVVENASAKGRRRRMWWLVWGVVTVVILTAVSWPRQARPSHTESPRPPPGVLWVSHPQEMYGIDPGGVTAVVVKAEMKRVWVDQFKKWPDLRRVTVEEGVELIDTAAFFGCPKLEAVSLPDSLKHVESYAFGDCFALREVRFGKGLLGVGQAAFGDCSNLLHVYYGGDAPDARGTRIYVRTPTNLVNHVNATAQGWTDRWPPNDEFSRPVLPRP